LARYGEGAGGAWPGLGMERAIKPILRTGGCAKVAAATTYVEAVALPPDLLGWGWRGGSSGARARAGGGTAPTEGTRDRTRPRHRQRHRKGRMQQRKERRRPREHHVSRGAAARGRLGAVCREPGGKWRRGPCQGAAAGGAFHAEIKFCSNQDTVRSCIRYSPALQHGCTIPCTSPGSYCRAREEIPDSLA
jgi:hypothetical protein